MKRQRSSKDPKNGAANGETVFDPAASRTQWLKGVLELCLLSIVARGEVYGYEISQQLETAGLGKIKGGTLYPRLAAMEANGLVEIEWRLGEHGPGRKYYQATPLGRAILKDSVAEYERFTETISDLLQLDHSGEQSNSSQPNDSLSNNSVSSDSVSSDQVSNNPVKVEQ